MAILGLNRVSLPDQFCYERMRIRDHRHLNSAFQFGQLGGVDIDHDLVGATRKLAGIPAHQRRIQPGTDDQQKITVLQGEIGAPRGHCSRTPHEQRVTVVQQVHGQPGQAHRHLELLHQFLKRSFGAGNPYAISHKD